MSGIEHSDSSNAVFAQALTGIKFPATQEQLVEQAEKNGTSEDVLNVIRHMPGKGESDTYNNMPDVYKNTRAGKEAYMASTKEGKQADKPKTASAKTAAAEGKK